jgi:hypothetical protein
MADDVIVALRSIIHSVIVLSGVFIYLDASSRVLWGGSDGMSVGY